MTTTVTVNHVGDDETFDVELRGHSATEHSTQILTHWLEMTGERIDLEPDEDDADDWVVREFRVMPDGRVRFKGVPYRGEEATFTYMPPEM